MNYDIRIPLLEPVFTGKEREYLTHCLETRWVSGDGEYVGLLEKRLSGLLGDRSAVGVSSGTAGLFLALLVTGVKPQTEVVVPALTFAATASPVVHLHAVPVFLDVEEQTLGLDPEKLEHFCRKRLVRRNGMNYNRDSGRAVAAVVVAHLYGLPARIGEIREICRRYGLTLIEDAAEALGARTVSGPCGTFGSVAVFSFNGNKLVSGGSGGMVVGEDADLLRQVRLWSNQYRDPENSWNHLRAGFNYRLNNLTAAVALAQLEKLPEKIERKRRLHETYQVLLQDFPGLRLLTENLTDHGTYWLNTVFLERPTALETVQQLREAGIETRPVFQPLHLMPAFAGYPVYDVESALHLARRGISLPSSENLTEDEQRRVVNALLAQVSSELAEEVVQHA